METLERNLYTYFPEQAGTWLDALPSLLEGLSKEWNIAIGDPLPNLSVNYVCFAELSEGNNGILKVGVPNKDVNSEIATLREFNGSGMVRLLKSDPSRGALLLERISPGVELATVEDDEEASTTAARVMQALYRQTVELHPDLQSVEDWFSGLAQTRKEYGGSGPLPEDLFSKAEALSSELLRSAKDFTLLHGDLHHYNILLDAQRGWLAIDPKGVVGEREFELCAFLRNPHEFGTGEDTRAKLDKRVQIFCEILGYDRKKVLSYGLAEAVLSASWDLGGEGRPWQKAIDIARAYEHLLGNTGT